MYDDGKSILERVACREWRVNGTTAMAQDENERSLRCGTCGGEMVQKSRLRLFIVGCLMVASLAVAGFFPYFLLPGIILLVTGGYLIVWAMLGKGRWCRECKKFSILHPHRVRA
jgi:hypothetical protein